MGLAVVMYFEDIGLACGWYVKSKKKGGIINDF
jgi:hypothetical protein